MKTLQDLFNSYIASSQTGIFTSATLVAEARRLGAHISARLVDNEFGTYNCHWHCSDASGEFIICRNRYTHGFYGTMLRAA